MKVSLANKINSSNALFFFLAVMFSKISTKTLGQGANPQCLPRFSHALLCFSQQAFGKQLYVTICGSLNLLNCL